MHRFVPANLSRSFCAALLILGLSAQSVFSQDYKPFSVLGTSNSLCRGGVETAAELQTFIANNPQLVQQVLADANWQGNPDDLFAAIAAGEFTEESYPTGSKFEWTSRQLKGVGESLPRRVWAGDQPFRGFEVNLASQCKVHKLVIPLECCNISLATTTDVATPVPSIDISADFSNVMVCSDSGDSAVITTASGETINATMDSNGCWNGEVAPGNISVEVTNSDECGVASATKAYSIAAAPIAATVAPPVVVAETVAKGWDILPYVAIFAGNEVRQRYEPDWDMYWEDSADILGARAGLLFSLSEKLMWFTQIGLLDRDNVNRNYIEANDTLFLDIGVDRRIGEKSFLGVGIGAWNIGDKEFDDSSLFVHGGSGIGSSNFQWHVEARVFGEELDNIDKDHLVTGGIRYLFK